MVSGRGREVQVLSSATAVVFLAQQPSDVAESWSSSCLDSCPSPTLGQNTGSAEHVGNAPLAGWQQVWVLGHREGSLLPYFSCNHRELEIHCVGATPAENLPTQAACGADVPAFSEVWCVWLSVHAYHLTITRTGRKVWLFFCCCCCFSFSS